jgi:hypothetical protein
MADTKEKTRRQTAPVTVTRLPVVNCAECGKPLPHQPVPGAASQALTEHYNEAHAPG